MTNSRPAVPESDTPETDDFLHGPLDDVKDRRDWYTENDYARLAAFARSLERRLSLAQTEIKGHMRVEEKLRKAVFDNLPYLENLINRCGHESVLLREHPQPCVGHDFCLMHQARKGADMLRAAIATKETQ